MVLAIVLFSLIAILVLSYYRTPIWLWAAVALAIGMVSMLAMGASGGFAWTLALLPAVVFGLFSIPLLRRLILTGPAYNMVRSILPRVSATEQEALNAGTVGWDADLFSGRPDWNNLLSVPKTALSAEEQEFIDGPVNELCAMIDDWESRFKHADLSPAVWKFVKEKKFLGMLISKEHGGLGFSAQGQSMIISKITSRSVTAGISVMVPNSLGPGELLEKYGTDAQKGKYLERLAKGLEVPCFALTGPHSGSDAAGMRDVGVVTYGMHDGERVLGVRLNFDKRYITLAPVATLVGLAFDLHDPDNHLGKGEHVGITLALVPNTHPGLQIGRRHFPAGAAFMNGPVRGEDVFVPLDFLIGGEEYVGQGWRMLMECLSTGRAISLPALGTTSIKVALRVTSAYARIRRQFGMPIGQMEGVAEPISRMIKSAYIYEAGRTLTAAMVDQGQKPAVISALHKYRTTEAMREAINDAMDVHGGRAVQDGPNNYLFGGYQTTPVAITVEGANILTRTLITFAQGALRAHPYLYKEIQAAQNENRREGIKAFDTAFAGHVSFMLGNMVGSFWQAISFGRFAPTPVQHQLAHWFRQLHRYSQYFALVGDWTVVVLGGDLKRKQVLSGRMADALSELYYLSATLKRWEDDGRIEEDLPIVEAIARDRIAAMESHLGAVIDNFPNGVLRFAMQALVFPFGRRAKPANDDQNLSLVPAVIEPSMQRDRLTRGVYVTQDPDHPTGMLEDALAKVVRVADIEKKFIRALRKGEISRRLDRDAITDAVTQGILTNEEAGFLRLADEATDRVIAVDDFAPDELARQRPSTPGNVTEAAE